MNSIYWLTVCIVCNNNTPFFPQFPIDRQTNTEVVQFCQFFFLPSSQYVNQRPNWRRLTRTDDIQMQLHKFILHYCNRAEYTTYNMLGRPTFRPTSFPPTGFRPNLIGLVEKLWTKIRWTKRCWTKSRSTLETHAR